MGHFALDSAIGIATVRRQSPRMHDLFWLQPVANFQWALMVRRTLPVAQYTKFIDIWNRRIPGGRIHVRQSEIGAVPVAQSWWDLDVAIAFTAEEETSGRNWLLAQGWRVGQPFVCVIVRDSEFLATDTLQNRVIADHSRQRWSYHDFRNSDIKDYIPAMEWLAEQGVFVLRMGKRVAERLGNVRNGIIDYANEPTKSDFLDIWLFANCTACVSTATGIDGIACLYRRPMLCINASPLTDMWTFCPVTWIPKNMVWTETQEPLTLQEQLTHSFGRLERFQEAGIQLKSLGPNEILDAVQDFWFRLSGTQPHQELDALLQRRFIDVYTAWPGFAEAHFMMHPDARVGFTWLRSRDENFFRVSNALWH